MSILDNQAKCYKVEGWAETGVMMRLREQCRPDQKVIRYRGVPMIVDKLWTDKVQDAALRAAKFVFRRQ